MSREFVSVEYSVASPVWLQHHLAMLYDFPSGSKFTFLYQGFHDTYLISNGAIHLVLRIYRKNWKSLESIKAEVEVLFQLKQGGADVSVPYKDRNGQCIHELPFPEGTRYAVVFMYAPGIKLKELKADTAEIFGRKLAGLHQVSQEMNHEGLQRYYYLGNIFNSAMENITSVMTDARIVDALKILYFKLDSWYSELDTDDLKAGICHGDAHFENAHFKSDSGKVTFFDFDFCGNGYLLYDVGTFCHYERHSQANVKAFLKGYHDVLPFSELEYRLIPFFTILMKVFHAGMRVKNADGIKNAQWPKPEILQSLHEIEAEVDVLVVGQR